MTADKGERIVVIGTGGAGLRAAERVRELNFAGELVIIGEEPYRPYHRPMLSKQVLTGSVRPRDVQLPTHDDLEAMWRPKTRVSRLDPDEHIVYLPGGEEIDYDGLIIATGMQPAHLPGSPRHDHRVHLMRNMNDAVAVQKRLATGKGRVALIGGGFLAGEVASAARELGRDTTIIIREPVMLDHVPGFDVSETVTALQEANGVRLVTNASVARWHTSSPDGVTMHLSTGEVVVADLVVLCVGGVPATDWLRGSGLLIDDGILCGPTTHAIGVDDVVAAGDVARWPNLRFDTVPRRVEHWMNAVEMGRAAADALLAGKDMAQPFTPLPKFWSEQHGVRIQGAGWPALAHDTVPLTEAVPVGSKITGYVAGGELVGILAWDSPRGALHYNYVLNYQTTEAMRRRMAEVSRQPAAEVQERREPRDTARRPLPPPERLQPMPSSVAPTGPRQAPVRPPMPNRQGKAGQPLTPAMAPANPSLRSNPSMPAVNPHASNPGMPPVNPGMPPPNASNPGMPPAHPSYPSMPPVNPAMRSNPSMPPVNPGMPPPNASSPNMPPAHPSYPSMPPVNPSLRSNPSMPAVNPHASNPGMPPAHPSYPNMPPVDPRMAGAADAPITELPPVNLWRHAS